MTVICGGATSQAKPGWDRILYVTPVVLGALLNNVPTRVALALAGAVGSLSFDLNAFCTTDPPAMPTITEDDIFALLNPINVFAYIAARQKFQDWLTRLLWIQACQCNSGPQPTPPSVPTAVNNFDPAPTTGAPITGTGNCMDATAHQLSFKTSGSNGPTTTGTGVCSTVNTRDISSMFFSTPGPLRNISGYTGQFQTYVLPTGPSLIQTFGHIYSGYPRAQFLLFKVHFWNSGGTYLGNPTPNMTPNNTNGVDVSGFQVSIPSGAAHVAVSLECCAGDPDAIADYRIVLSGPNCGGGFALPCCPPDESTSALLQQILGYVQLIQRQVAPFAYVAGTAHAGLSGHGELTVQGLIGARVTLTSYGSAVGLVDGDPQTVFDAGWINFGDTSGFEARRFINASPIQFFPAAAGQFTRIGYSLQPGVVATITELVREP